MLISRNNMLIRTKHPKRRQTFADITNDLLINTESTNENSLSSIKMAEDETFYGVEMTLVDIEQEAIKLYIEDGNLYIEYPKEDQNNENETTDNSYCRCIKIPSDVNPKKISASFHEGILYIALPKISKAHNDTNVQKIPIE